MFAEQCLKRALAPGARAALQFYPEASQHVGWIAEAAKEAGLSGGLIIDYPNNAKGKKFFVCVQAPGKRVFPVLAKKAAAKKAAAAAAQPSQRRASKSEMSVAKKRKLQAKIGSMGWAPGMWRHKKKGAEHQEQDQDQEETGPES
eukprot:TRINITY_DN9785_c0_g1_i11.p1 TRINITY_DN9785_c0_g1~~TRINITY_DN9785_c0_g1_i11.p1  ORF type:complete len:145 (+),score=38.59 TRINITY_DN9785_c0_g1_i11:801-1235(+)